MAVRAYGQLIIQATAPSEAPTMVGTVWSDTSTGLVKVCTSVSPFTFVTVHGGSVAWSDITDFTGSSLAQLATRSASDLSSGTLAVARGGTAIGSYTVGDLLFADGAASLAKLAAVASGSVLTSAGTGTAPAWASAVTLTTSLTTPKLIGGTGTTSILTVQPTSGAGVAGSDIVFLGGNNGATKLARMYSTGFFEIGTPSTASGTNTPGSFDFHSTGNSSSAVCVFDRFNSAASGYLLLFRHARGSAASPSKTLSGDQLGFFAGRGWEDVTPGWTTPNNAAVIFAATQDFTNAAQGSKVQLNATANGSTTAQKVMEISPDAWSVTNVLTLPGAGLTRLLNIDENGKIGTVVNSPASYTPTLTDITIGNGSVTATQIQIGKIVHWEVKITFGTTTTLGALPRFTLPTAAQNAQSATAGIYGYALDASANTSYRMDVVQTDTSTLLIVIGATTYAPISTTTPFTWATTDTIQFGGSYVAA